MGDLRVKPCRHGRLMYYHNDYYIGGSLTEYSEYSEGEIQLWQQFIRPGMNVVEVGANIGMFTVWLAKTVGPSGRVYAFEPQRRIYQMLIGNLALNELDNVFTMQAACGSERGQIYAPAPNYDDKGNFGGVDMVPISADGKIGDPPVSVATLTKGEVVPLVRLDDMLPPGPVHFVKVDVEGMEEQVLRGATALLTGNKPILYVENDRKENSSGLIRYLRSIGYKLYWHTPPLFNPNNFNRSPTNLFGTVVSINMLCVHSSIGAVIAGLTEVSEVGHGN